MTRGTALLLMLALFSAPADAAPIYKTKDERGNIVYTDDPQGRPAELVELPDLTIVPATPLPAPAPEPAAEPEAEAPLAIELLAPEQDATLRSNAGNLEVVARVNRAPDEGDRFEVLLDGAVRGRNAGGTFALTAIDRGPHRVSVRLVDADGNVVAQSGEHSFFLLRHSRLHP
ncbi:MAG: DUF4124 domain-containing protein [Pseudomonadales bacterium]|jgi:hypothetical protein|nr:DUF4124 domain-containing protein [Pseudomonadales bacterium]